MQEQVSNKLEGEEVGQVKMSKIEKFFLSQKEKFNKHLAGFENQIAVKVNKFVADFNKTQTDFINTINLAVANMDKKYGGMYNMLIKKFLVELENRIYTSELSNKTMLVVFAEKFHKIESDMHKIELALLAINSVNEGTKPKDLGTALSLTDYVKDMEGQYAIKMTEIHNATQKANEQATAEVENVQEPVQQQEASAEQPVAQ